MNEFEKDIMDRLYSAYDVPSDTIGTKSAQHKQRFADLFNEFADTDYSGDEVATLLMNRRKAGHLPRLVF